MIVKNLGNIKQTDKDRYYNVCSKALHLSFVPIISGVSKFSSKKEVLLKRLGYIKFKSNNYYYLSELQKEQSKKLFNHYEKDLELTYINIKHNKKVRDIKEDDNVYVIGTLNRNYCYVSNGYYVEENNKRIPVDLRFISITTSKTDLYILEHIYYNLLRQYVYNSEYGYIAYQVSNADFIVQKIESKDYNIIDTVSKYIDDYFEDEKNNKDKPIEEILSSYRIGEVYDRDSITWLAKMEDIHRGDEDDEEMLIKYLDLLDKMKELEEHKKWVENYLKDKYIKYKEVIVGQYRISLEKDNIYVSVFAN